MSKKNSNKKIGTFRVWCSNDNCYYSEMLQGTSLKNAMDNHGYRDSFNRWFCCEDCSENHCDADWLYCDASAYGLGQE